MGDFNLTEIDWENCSRTNKNPKNINFQFAKLTKDCYLYQHITEHTWQRGSDNPSTLDLIFPNGEDMVSDIEIEAPLGKSDHSIIYFTFNCATETSPPEIKTTYQKGDYAKMKNILFEYDWENLQRQSDDINKQWELFKNIFLDAENQCVPRKLTYVNGKLSKKLSIPLDKKTLAKIKKKNKLWGRIRKLLLKTRRK